MMTTLNIFLGIVGAYFFAVFFLSRFFIPFMGFRKYQTPRELPSDMQNAIRKLEQQSADARAYLENAYHFVQERWHAERLKTITHFPLIFRTNIETIWKTRGYAHCTTINFILFTLLANSKFFTKDDMRIRHAFLNMVLHQYMQVRVGIAWLDVDPSTVYAHRPIGKRKRFFA